MLRNFGNIIALATLVVLGSIGLMIYRQQTAAERKIDKLEVEKKVLERVVQRLGEERRIADLVVTEQTTINGISRTTLLLVETSRAGKQLAPRSFTIEGRQAHLDAMVIKFDQHFVREGDPMRGQSLALFTRIYGDHQNPAAAPMVDKPGEIPLIYRDADPKISEFEGDLWKNFWRLVDDEPYRKEKGVRVAGGHGLWWTAEFDKLYTVSIEADGGLNLVQQPLPEIYKALRRNQISSN